MFQTGDELQLSPVGRRCAETLTRTDGKSMNSMCSATLLDPENYPIIYVQHETISKLHRFRTAKGKYLYFSHTDYFEPAVSEPTTEEFASMLP